MLHTKLDIILAICVILAVFTSAIFETCNGVIIFSIVGLLAIIPGLITVIIFRILGKRLTTTVSEKRANSLLIIGLLIGGVLILIYYYQGLYKEPCHLTFDQYLARL